MGFLTVQVAGASVKAKAGSFSLEDTIDNRSVLKFTIEDTLGTGAYQNEQSVNISDSVLGLMYTGFINTAVPNKLIPRVNKEWIIVCKDNHWLADKRLNFNNYVEISAGDMVASLVGAYLASEGVIVHSALKQYTAQGDFVGTLSNTIATPAGDGDLELTASNSAGASIITQSDWNTKGTKSNTQANAGGDLSLIGVTRNWDNGVKTGQTLFGLGSPSDSVTGGVYNLSCAALSETLSRLDFAGTWANATVSVDLYVGSTSARTGLTYRTTTWNNTDDYAYAIELTTTFVDLRKGNNGAGGSTSSISKITFTNALAAGWYTLKVVFSGSSHTVYINGTQYISASDGTYTAAGNIALRNRNS